MMASAMKTYEVYIALLFRPYEKCQVVHPRDTRPAAGGDRRVAVVAHGPEGAAVLRLAALARAERDRERDRAARGAGLNVRQRTIEALVDAAAKAHHRHDREDSEECPLQPGR